MIRGLCLDFQSNKTPQGKGEIIKFASPKCSLCYLQVFFINTTRILMMVPRNTPEFFQRTLLLCVLWIWSAASLRGSHYHNNLIIFYLLLLVLFTNSLFLFQYSVLGTPLHLIVMFTHYSLVCDDFLVILWNFRIFDNIEEY